MYAKAILEIVEFDVEDVIVTSGTGAVVGGDEDEDPLPTMPPADK